MNIAIFDMVFNKGHVNFNKNLIKLLSRDNNVFVINDGNYYSNNDVATYINVNIDKEPNGRFIGRLKMYNNIMRQVKAINNIKIDHIIVLSADYITFSFTYKKMLKISNVSLIHHNISQLNSKVKYYYFKKYMNKIQNIVLGEFMIEGLKNKQVKSEKIFFLPHPIYSFPNKVLNPSKRSIIAISGSNDEKMIESFCSFIVVNEVKFNSNIKITIKSSKLTFKNESIEIIHKYLDRNEYDELYSLASASIIFLPGSFLGRISGCALETLAAKKVIIGTNQPFIRELKQKYPSLVYIFETNKELVDIINTFEDGSTSDFDKFYDDFSNRKIIEAFQKILKG